MTNPTPHGQVPEALIDLIDAYAETRHRCGGIYNAKTEAARNAVIEALSGVQALSAAPATPPAEQPIGEVVVTKTEDGQIVAVTRQDDEGHILSVIATCDPSEQQAQPGAIYAELHEPDATTVGLGAVWNRHSMRDFADRTHALRMQAAPKAAPVKACVCGEPQSSGTVHRVNGPCYVAAPKQEAQPNYVVSLVVVKEIPTGVNTQNKLYTVNAASADEAVGKAVLQMHNDFPEHRLHTACFVAIPAQPAPKPAPDCHHRPPCDECAALAAQRGNK